MFMSPSCHGNNFVDSHGRVVLLARMDGSFC